MSAGYKPLPLILFYTMAALSAFAIFLLYSTSDAVTPLFILALAVLVAAIVGVSSILLPGFAGAPWVPTKMDLIKNVLSLAELKPGEILYDLGSGDGRLVIAAAKDFGARAVGVEIDPFRVFYSRLKILRLGLNGTAKIIRRNFFSVNVSDADVVVLFLLQKTNDKLQAKLERELKKPGCRVVSIVFKFEGWKLIRADEENMIYAYRPEPS